MKFIRVAANFWKQIHVSFFSTTVKYFYQFPRPCFDTISSFLFLSKLNPKYQEQHTHLLLRSLRADSYNPLCWPLLHLPQGLGVRRPGTTQLFKPSGSFSTGRRQKQREGVREKKAADYLLLNMCLESAAGWWTSCFDRKIRDFVK